MSDAVIFHQNELPVVIASSSINFKSYSFLHIIVGAPSIALPDMLLTRVNENCFNKTFTASYKWRDLVLSFNSTKEAISSVIHYQYLWWKWTNQQTVSNHRIWKSPSKLWFPGTWTSPHTSWWKDMLYFSSLWTLLVLQGTGCILFSVFKTPHTSRRMLLITTSYTRKLSSWFQMDVIFL